MLPINSQSINWKNVDYSDYSACGDVSIFRRGEYSCQFDNYYETGQTVTIRNLNTNWTVGRVRLQNEESIREFCFPYLLTSYENELRVRDIASYSREPCKIFRLDTLPNFFTLHKATISGNTIVMLYSDVELFMKPQYLAVIRDFESAHATPFVTRDEGIDEESDLIVEDGQIFYSVLFGNIAISSLQKKDEYATIPPRSGVASYLNGLSIETLKTYRQNCFKSLVKEGHTLVAASKKAIKIYDLTSQALQNTIPVEERYHLMSLSGRFLMGYTYSQIRFWDIISGDVVHEEQNKTRACLPELTHYKDKIFRVNSSHDLPDITFELNDEHYPPTKSARNDRVKPVEEPSESEELFSEHEELSSEHEEPSSVSKKEKWCIVL